MRWWKPNTCIYVVVDGVHDFFLPVFSGEILSES